MTSEDDTVPGDVQTSGVQTHMTNPTDWSQNTTVQLVDDALIVVTQAYDQDGNPLITDDNPKFGGHPGVRLLVRTDDHEYDVVLSPIHGHNEKIGGDGIPDGALVEICSPATGNPLPFYGPHASGVGSYRSIYLSPELNKAHVVAVYDVWGMQDSRIIDEYEILSEFVASETAGDEDGS
jgi:hypothetical protein